MQLYDTLTRKLEPVVPSDDKSITLYSCGPTVYDFAHIGNLRKFVFDDLLRRTLTASGFNVRHVMNITDVGHLTSDADEGEDKGEKGARREGVTVREIADKYTAAFIADMRALHVLEPNVNPLRSINERMSDPYARATDFIPEQLEMVNLLLDRGYAYKTDQAIYFDVTKLADYGKLSGQKLADKEVGARTDVVTDAQKRNPHDFAIWFFLVGRFADHSMHWPSPWGDGFPGWHLECSAIIHATLGDPINIHTGGVDHIGTHHPNEMAQTEGAFGHDLAGLWIHSQFILVDGAKMAKSKNNFYTLADITAHDFEPIVLRYLYLQAHYRTELNFSFTAMHAARQALLSLQAWADRRFQDEPVGLPSDWYDQLVAILSDDLASPAALARLFLWLPTSVPQKSDLDRLDDLLGLGLSSGLDLTAAQKQLVAQRNHARDTKDWAEADTLRDALAAHSIAIDDTSSGPRWRKTKLHA